ncbi:DUF6603 domain-containing protein [Pseudooctadecabacter jejudonensis]|uniref:DUF6603 domain-containing protein n=1 Tax=Pseudooctadecabacter jejudonensis TaxID=1391910 RepID=A0A1Y5SIP4_9RHOB|nr:DUF6603 domain-containing protein [Pseudooctadecabacter jejudonensis]SLN41037.1 hypothetical protein PSJ8397_02050 [Pseudooctadecabacter jejudonensis]
MFEFLKTQLLKHLPHPHARSPFQITTEGLVVEEPGIAVRDIAALIADISGNRDFLPSDMTLPDLRISDLRLTRTPDVWGGAFACTVEWGQIGLTLADDINLKLDNASVHLETKGTRLLGTVSAGLIVEDMTLDVTLDLPSQFITGTLAPSQHATAIDFLTARNLCHGTTAPVIEDLTVEASLPLGFLAVHLELADVVTMGPVRIVHVTTDLEIAGAGEEASFEAAAKVEIAVQGQAPLALSAAGQVDRQGWRLAGELDAPPGRLSIGDLVGTIAVDLHMTAPQLPNVIKDLSLTHLGLALDTHTDHFQLDCTLDWSHAAQVVVHIAKTGTDFDVSASLTIEDVTFKIAFEDHGAAVLVASFDAAGHAKMTLDQLIAAFSGGKSPFGPPAKGVSLEVKSAAIALDSKAQMLLGAELNAGIDLSEMGDLPLVGALLPEGGQFGLSMIPAYRGKGFTDADATAAAKAMPAGIHIDPAMAPGFKLEAHLTPEGTFGARDLGTKPDAAQPPDTPPKGPQPALPGALSWSDVDAHLGPLHIKRLGYFFDPKSKSIDVAFDAELGLMGLHLSVDGLSAHYDFGTRQLTPRLNGLGVDLARGPLEIGGAFLNQDGDFAGALTLSTSQFSLNALGAFTMDHGTPSMFVYGVLSMPLGGPPFFFVEGLAAGFGLHRHLSLPPVSKIHEFPLIVGADPARTGPTTPAAQAAALHDYVHPKLGAHFIAVGVKFSSFKLLEGFAVLVAALSEELEVDIVGTATLTSPPKAPPNVPAMARVTLDLLARVIPAEGRIAVEARISPQSYVYSPLCHLSGGFAFYSWLKDVPDQHIYGGDFVLTLGGYHPAFDKPSHYPTVPRIELKYQITPEVYVKGDAYFALTPSTMMAGGHLHLQASIGALHAWADFSADFLVAWEPFHYDVRVHFEVGAKWKCFHTTASADLQIWGPPFTGVASVDWWACSFDVHFGHSGSFAPVPISTSKFKESFLDIDESAASQTAALGIVPTAGVVAEKDGVSCVSPVNFEVRVSTKVPITDLTMGATSDTHSAPVLGVAPCGTPDLGTSAMTIQVVSLPSRFDVTDHFKMVSESTAHPPALWGQALKPDQNAKPIVCLSGAVLRAAHPAVASASQAKKVKDMQFNPKAVGHTYTPTTPGAPGATLIEELQALGLDTTGMATNAQGGFDA